MRFILCTRFCEFCSCCSLAALPGPAWVVLNWICKELISSLYILPRDPDYDSTARSMATQHDLLKEVKLQMYLGEEIFRA